MKKIIYMLVLLCFMGIAFADVDFTEAINNSTMPTDAEIRTIISQFNFNQEQQDALFKETKKKLKEMYSGKNLEQTNAELNYYYSQLNDENVNTFMTGNMKQELRRDVSKLPKKTTKKMIPQDEIEE